jgi:broad specificity phosphatase PhoE
VDDPARERALTPTETPLVPDGLDATLVLVRHGESTFIAEGRFQGQAETPLTEIGLRQAALVGERLATPHAAPSLPIPVGPPLDLVHSPLLRTAQTADAIDAALRRAGWTVSRRPDAGFAEIHQGAWQGLHRDEVAARYGEELATWRRSPLDGWAPGGESLPEVQARVRPVLAALLARLGEGRPPGTHDRPQVAGYADEPTEGRWSVVVGHDGVFKVALLTLFDLPLERFWMWSMDLCAITVVEFRAGRPVLRAHDLTAHLAPLEGERGAVAMEAAETVAEDRSRSGAL